MKPQSELQSDRRRHLQRAAIAPGVFTFTRLLPHLVINFAPSPFITFCYSVVFAKLRQYQTVFHVVSTYLELSTKASATTIHTVSHITFLSRVIDHSQTSAKLPETFHYGASYQKFCSQGSTHQTFHSGKGRADAAFKPSNNASTSQCTKEKGSQARGGQWR
jgi:hypothetical protein